MSVERAVVKGLLFGTVEVRNVFTADIYPAGGDTNVVLWMQYLGAIYDAVTYACNAGFATYEVELSFPVAGQWPIYDVEAFVKTGARTGEPLPNVVSIVLLGVAAGVRHVGRKFFGGLDEASTIGNVIASGEVAHIATALLAYITPATGLGAGLLQPGVVDKTGTFHPFIGGIVSSLLGSMRRRKPGIGI